MSTINYLYLIKTVDDNKVLLVTTIKTFEGVTRYEGMPCTVLNSYTPPIDLAEVLSDIQNSSTEPQQIITHHGRKPTGKIYTDHLGNTFDSIHQMCTYHNVSVSGYRTRLARGRTQEEALASSSSRPKQVTDHCGNIFNSKTDMCKFYGISLNLFNSRARAGKSLEEVLLGTRKATGTLVEDHLGNQYNSQVEMAQAYGLSQTQYFVRKHNGWDIERILTTPIHDNRKGKSFDFNGITYISKKVFCEKHGLNYQVFMHRIHSGMTIEDAFSAGKASSAKKAVDHNGKEYANISKMCEAYGLSVSTYKYRRDHGWDARQALTTPTHSSQIAPPKKKRPLYYDHKGNAYTSKTEMCKSYGINRYFFEKRLAEGMSLQDALELPVIKKAKQK